MDSADTDETGLVTTRPSSAAQLVDRLVESRPTFDGLGARLAPLAQRVRGRGAWRRAVTGEALGHAAHPFLTDLPIGFWTSATVLDLVGGHSAAGAARKLVGLGLLSAPAAALTGFAEYAALSKRPQRVATVHASLNVLSLALYAASWAARPEHRRVGVGLGLAGLSVSGISAYLGGHLSIGEKVGTSATVPPDVESAASTSSMSTSSASASTPSTGSGGEAR